MTFIQVEYASMTDIKKSLVVPYTSTQMYDLVTNLEKYPEFISWCKGVEIHSQAPYKIKASLRAVKLGMDFTFPIIYQLEPNQSIKIFLLNKGPFRNIEALWRFQIVNNNATQLGLEIQYELSNTFLGWTLTPLIKNEVNHILKDFSKRAVQIYGPKV